MIDRQNGQELSLPDGARLALVNRESGKPIPEDEPTFIVLARDNISPEVLTHYKARATVYGCGSKLMNTVNSAEINILEFRRLNHERTKDPD